MEEQEQNTSDMAEFEAKSPASGRNSKDLWLFLIIADVVLLCVFGFFLYKNLSAKLLASVPVAVTTDTLDVAFVPEEPVFPEDLMAQKEPIALPAEEVKQPAEPQPEEKPIQNEVVQPAPAAPVAETVSDKKESISVQVNPKSKYRQVTFRYFGDAKEVAVVSGFTMSKPRAMTKKGKAWEITLAIAPGTYKYLFVVDGHNTKDPYAPEKDDRSLLVLE